MAAKITRALALLLLGTYAGGVVCNALAPSVYALPGAAYVRFWQAENVDYGAAMPVLLLSCIALLVITALLSIRRGRGVFLLTVVATVLVVATVVVTVTQMEPLNKIANSWNPDQLPANWASYVHTWRSWQVVRTVLAVAAFVALLVSQLVERKAGAVPNRTAARVAS